MSSEKISSNSPVNSVAAVNKTSADNMVTEPPENKNMTAETASLESKLLPFGEQNTVGSGKDINTKITALDTDLAHLRAELSAINSSVEEGFDRLGDSDTDLTAKVSETYKRLGEIDNAYKSLLEISSRIDADIKKLNGDVSAVAQVSASGIKHLEQSGIAQTTEFANKNQQVVSRVNQLVETSKLTGELLSQKIQVTTDKILQVEQQVVAEIQHLSSATDEKTKTLEHAVSTNKAKILKLQSVDEAIIKRATTLEISSAELEVKSQQLKTTTQTLEQNTNNLLHGLNELQEKTRALELEAKSHGSLIKSLQTASSSVVKSIAALSEREDKRFTLVIGSFAMIAVLVALLFFLQYENIEQVKQGETVLSQQVSDLQQGQEQVIANTGDSLFALETKVLALNLSSKTGMQEEVNKVRASADKRLQKIEDQLQSVEGRINNELVFSQIANDNIIHGSQWLLEQNNDHYTIQVAYLDDRQSMYTLAQDYNFYLQDSLAYFESENSGKAKYVLLSGSYADRTQALHKLKSLPVYIDGQRPVLRTFAEIQKYIGRPL